MNLVSALISRLLKLGGWPVAAWVALCVLTILIYRAYDAPLDAPELLGVAFVYAVVCYGAAILWGLRKSRIPRRRGARRRLAVKPEESKTP
jgi:hypothetical protein